MEANDPFASILKFCQPTASQLALFPSLPFHREFDEFQDPDPYPGCSDRVVSSSRQESHKSAGNQAEGSAVFHRPPEQHLSSSGDQNPNKLCADGATGVELRGGAAASKKGKGIEGGLGDEIGSKKTRVPGVESRGDEIGGAHDVDCEIIDSGHWLGKKTADKGKMVCETSGVVGNLDNGEGGDEIDGLRYLFSRISGEVASQSGISSKDGNGNEGRRTACRRIEDIDEFRFTGWDDAARKWEPRERDDVSVPRKRKRELPATMREMGKNEGVLIKGNDKNDRGTNEAGKEKPGSDVAAKAEAKKDQLNDEKGKNEGGSNVARKLEKGGLSDILGILKSIVKNVSDDEGNDIEDIRETAKKCGMTFPRPRWRSPEGKQR